MCQHKYPFLEQKLCFEKELDNDLQPHRATEASNQIIKVLGLKNNVPMIDLDKEIVDHANNNIPGFDLFIDHCHLNNKGNQIIQNEIAHFLTTMNYHFHF